MLSLFPQILFLAPFSASLIRVALAVMLAYAAWHHFKKADTFSRVWAVLELAAGIAIFLGIYTQGVALAAFIGIALGLIFARMRVYPMSTMLLALVMSLSLVVTGAGVFAFDLPL
jgi:hypothetical protein